MIEGTLRKFRAAMKRLLAQDLDKKVARVGWFEGARYEDGTPVAYVAAIQEYGAPARGIPPRPFMRPALDAHKDEWLQTVADGARAIVRGQATAEQVLDAAGLQAKGDIQAQIEATTSPALERSTLMRRKYRRKLKSIDDVPDTPLRDTGLLIASVWHTVDEA